jgi:hypothetical protein
MIRPTDSQGTKVFIDARIETLRGGRPRRGWRRLPRPN